MDIVDSAKNILNDIISWRRELHKIPELGFKLYNTSGYIAEQLENMGIKYSIAAESGIVALIEGVENGSTVALRADMDALPVFEETGLPFASTNGCMHACGHDAHAAMLLGAAKILSDNKMHLKGNVKLLFQPAEENEGGAERMIKEGCLLKPRVDAVFGLHIGNLPPEVGGGMIGVKSGALLASIDRFVIKVRGKGGHGAAPEKCIDPILIASEIVCSLQKIVSREISSLNSAVLTVGRINGGTAFNIIPGEVVIEGAVRTLNDTDRTLIESRIKEIAQGISVANRAQAEIIYFKQYPVLINDAEFTEMLAASAEKVVGSDKVVFMKQPIMGSEDMAYFLNKVPGTFFFLGSNNIDKGIVYPHHNSKFDIDEDVLWIGSAVFAQAVFDYFKV